LNKKAVILICNLFILVPLFAQVPFSEFDRQVQEFADEINPVLPFAANQGLNWSSPYAGQLIGYPMHFGVGFFFSSAFMNNDKPSSLGELMGLSLDDSMIKNKQWFPNYVIGIRLGGIGRIPFDIGIKFGYISEMELWSSLENYTSMIFGFDIHYPIFITNEGNPVVVVSLGYDRLEGGAGGATSTAISGILEPTSGSEPMYLAWESNTFKAQIIISQPLMSTGLRFFGGLDVGFGLNKAGVKTVDLYSPAYENMKEVTSLLFSGSVGVGYEFSIIRIDATFVWNFINFESGVSFGIRYQR
jgi:hypothetical protein